MTPIAQARTPERMMQDCRVRAHEILHTRLPDIETKYEGQRTDGTHAVNGTAWIRGRTETFQCSFNRSGRYIVDFKVNAPGVGGSGGSAQQLPQNEPETRTERIRFPAGTTGTEVRDSLSSGSSIRYVLRARKNQFLHVHLATNNRRTYFNIFTPDGHTLYESVRAGNDYRGQLWLDGDHVVEVYNLARRNASFSVSFDLEGRPGQGGNAAGGDRFARVRADCVDAVARQVGGGRKPSVIDVERGENFLTVRVRVPGAQAPWICEHSTREVMRVYYGSRG